MWFARAGAALIATLAANAPRAQTVEEFYRGKTITLVVGSAPGGGYDTISRAVSRHLGKHIPGNPQIIVRNMPGSGSIAAVSFLSKIAPRDGTAIGCVQNNAAFEPLFGTKEADYDPMKLTYLGGPALEIGTLITWHQSRAKTLEDARRHEVTVGASGANSAPAFFARLLNEVLGMKLKVINGYAGQNEAWLAMERGEIEGYGLSLWSSVTGGKPDWLRDGKLNVIVQYGPERDASIPAPYGPDLVTKEDDKLLFEAAYGSFKPGRPFLAPPDVPADRAAALRAAMDATWADPAFQAEAERVKMPVDRPATGAELQAMVERAYRLPPRIIERLRAIAQSY